MPTKPSHYPDLELAEPLLHAFHAAFNFRGGGCVRQANMLAGPKGLAGNCNNMGLMQQALGNVGSRIDAGLAEIG